MIENKTSRAAEKWKHEIITEREAKAITEKYQRMEKTLKDIAEHRIQAVDENGGNLHDTTELEEVLGEWIHQQCERAEDALSFDPLEHETNPSL